MELLANVMTFFVILIGIYFIYQLANLFVSIRRARKEDKTLVVCTNAAGKIFYIGISVAAVAGIAICIGLIIYAFKTDSLPFFRNSLAAIVIILIIYVTQMSNIVHVGKRNMMVGRMLIDYRKMKKVDITYSNEMTFVYGQKSYKFSTRFVELTTLRKAISRRR